LSINETPSGRERQAVVLALACLAQFMVILDVAVVNVALPSIQHHFHTGRGAIEWVVIAYGLLLGGFLLSGGRLTDLFGPRRVLCVGLVVFSLASLGAGTAPDVGWLIAARAVQGLGAALIPPSALSVIAGNFAEGQERSRALGLFGAVSGISASVGVIASGLITANIGWRWIFLINVPIGVLLIGVATTILAPGTRAQAGRGDLSGAATATGGLVTLIYALNRGATHGWGSPSTLGLLALSLVLFSGFGVLESRASAPLVPKAVLRSRTLVGANLAAFFAFGSVFAFIFLGSLLMQQQLGYPPTRTGVAGLATRLRSFRAAATTGSVLVRRVGVRPLLITGQTLLALAALWLTRIPAHGHYLDDVLPALVVAGTGGGLAAPAAQIAALSSAKSSMVGIASGLLETLREIGGAVSVAIVSTVLVAHHTQGVHAFHLAYVVIVVLGGTGALVSVITLPADGPVGTAHLGPDQVSTPVGSTGQANHDTKEH
jgi:EmrB/QacA subfamily drug resistance transporter